jgi:predicted RNA-binding Zn-ribbon protein involved in translation (DUF1610 family)
MFENVQTPGGVRARSENPPLVVSGAMSALVFTCPTTGRDIVSGINTDQESLSHVQQLPVSLFCPNCGKVHRLTAKDGRLSNASLMANSDTQHQARI